MNEILGRRIKELRIIKKFTQEQVADQIGISRRKYAGIESGADSITLDNLSKVAEVLEINAEDITRALDETPVIAYKAGEEGESLKKIFDMLDLFYANKHMCTKLQRQETLEGEGCSITQRSAKKNGIFRPECGFCDLFEAGTCLKNGRLCDPPNENGCLRNDHKITLCYDKEPVLDLVILGEPLIPGKIAEIIKGEYENVRDVMNRSDYDSNMWSYY